MTNIKSPSNVDREVGKNVRAARERAGLTIAELASEIGITHQQFQKYETGENRMSAGRIYAVSQILSVGISDIFDFDQSSDSAFANDPLINEKHDIIQKLLKLDDAVMLNAIDNLLESAINLQS